MSKQTAYIKRIISVVLMMSVLLMMTPVWERTVDSAEITDGEITIPPGGFTVEGNLYKIYTVEAFTELLGGGKTDKLSKDFELMVSIDLGGKDKGSWTPIGNSGNAFKGTFNGNGLEISGLYIDVTDKNYQALFGNVSGGTIQGLTVSGEVTSKVSGTQQKVGSYVGGIVGRNSNGEIHDCINKVTVTGGGNRVGGVVGDKKGGKITGCRNEGTVTGTGDYTGGIAGFNDSCTLQRCNNFGKVIGDSSVGGIVGGNSGGTIGGSIEEACTNNAEVTGGNQVGGIVGRNNNNGSIDHCTNNAAVKGTGDYAGGVVGKSENGTASSCENKGAVTGVTYVGGVAGSNAGTVEGCINKAAVSGDGDRVGGVAGENQNTVRVCYNTGVVTGQRDSVGGVVGDNAAGTVEICYNTGDVTGTQSKVGGVVGNNNQGAVLQKSYNTGAVDGNTSVGGIAGNTAGTVENCYNVGAVSGKSACGEALGSNSGSTRNCFFFPRDPLLNAIGSGSAGGVDPIPASAAEFAEDVTFTAAGWNFSSVWEMGTTRNGDRVRPVLRDIPEHPLEPLPIVESPGDPDSSDPESSDPTSSEPESSDPDSSDPTSSGPTSSEPDSSEPESSDPESSDPTSSEPESSDPTSSEPESSDPDSSEPDSSEPTSSDPNGNSSNNNSGSDTHKPSTGDSTPQQPSTSDTTTPSDSSSEPSTGDSEPADTDSGNVNIDTAIGENAPETTISDETSDKLIDEVIEEHLTDEEKTAVENGDDLDIILRVEDAGDTVSDGDRQATEAVLTDTGYTVGMYLNIDLIKLINGVEVGKITRINSPIRVTIEIPKELRKANRAFAIVRVHDGSAEVIEDVDYDPDTITILTDRFSTYSIAYRDTAPVNPGTGSPFTAIAAGAALCTAAVTFRRKKDVE